MKRMLRSMIGCMWALVLTDIYPLSTPTKALGMVGLTVVVYIFTDK